MLLVEKQSQVRSFRRKEAATGPDERASNQERAPLRLCVFQKYQDVSLDREFLQEAVLAGKEQVQVPPAEPDGAGQSSGSASAELWGFKGSLL